MGFLDHARHGGVVFGEDGLDKLSGTLVGFYRIGPGTLFECGTKRHAHFLVGNENLRYFGIIGQIANMRQQSKAVVLALGHRKRIVVRACVDIDAPAANQAHHVVVDAVQIRIDIVN